MNNLSKNISSSQLIDKTNDTPRVSVIMNCYNCSKYLREAIDSVYAQTYKNWQIIFWDNASTDNSADIANSYDKRLRYFRGEKTVPLYEARNLALKEATGKYIAFLDCDDMWLSNKLELQVKALEENKIVGLVHTNVEILEHHGSRRILHKKVLSSGKVFREILRDYRINLQTVMISRKVLELLNYWFDESMNHAGDADLFLRIAYNWEVLYIPEVTARYREHKSSETATKIEALLIENEKVLKNISERYHDFQSKYKYEIKGFKRKTRLSVIIAKWKYSSGAEARKYIVKHCSNSLFFFILLPFTFLPFKFIHFIRYRISNPFIQ